MKFLLTLLITLLLFLTTIITKHPPTVSLSLQCNTGEYLTDVLGVQTCTLCNYKTTGCLSCD